MQIHKTVSYEKFKLAKANRGINWNKVRRMSQAIQENNFLKVYPIIVDKNNQVLDGQHRFLAAKDTNVPIYYVVHNKMSIENVAAVNSLQDKWKHGDYIEHFAAMGNKNYQAILDKQREWGVNISLVIEIMGLQGSDYGNIMREGKLEVSPQRVERASKFFNALMDVAEYAPFFWTNKMFVRAYKRVFFHKGYLHRRMLKKMSDQQRKLVKCATAMQYQEMLQEIYNWHETNDKKVNFLF